MAITTVAQAQATHQQAHSAFLSHVQNFCSDCTVKLCREARGLELDADAAGSTWQYLEAKRPRYDETDRISLTEAGAAYLAQRQAVAVS